MPPAPPHHEPPECEPEALRAHDRRVVTVLFADICGFTALAQDLDPEDLASVLNGCFEAVTRPIVRFGGVVDKYIGDAVMAVFGAPVAREDDALRALAAAWEMRAAAEAFARQLRGERGIHLALRIGVNTGLVVAGAFGSSVRRDDTVLGDAVNLAQRMEAAADPGTVLVGPETRRLAGEHFRFLRLPPLKVKGRARPLRPYRLLGPETGGPGIGACPPPELVGREAELEELRARWARALLGRPQVLALLGEAGLGKTALVEAFRAEVEPAGARWCDARCLSYGPEGVGGVAGQLLAACGADPAQGPDEAAARLAALSRTRPLVLAVDDLQHADEASATWWAGLHAALGGPAGAGARVLLISQQRPPVGEAPNTPSRALPASPLDRLELHLRPLSPHEGLRLVGRELGLEGEPQAWPATVRELAEALVGRGEGNPLFLRELAANTREQGVTSRDRLDPEALPLTVNGVIAARLDGLPAEARRVLQVASVLGRAFRDAELAALAPVDGLPPAALEPALEVLGARGLLVPAGPGARAFDRALTQEVAYQALLHAQRRRLHAAAAAVLEAAGAGAGRVAHHLARAGDGPERARVLRYLRVAADRASTRGATREATEALERALTLTADPADRIALLEALGRVRAVAGDAGGAIAALSRAEAHALTQVPVEPALVARLRRLAGEAAERQGDLAGALARYVAAREAIEGAPEVVDGGEAARLAIAQAWLLVRTGRPAEAEARAREALARTAEPADRALATSVHGVALDRLGRWAEARKAHRQALGIRRGLGDAAGVAASLNNLGMACVELGRWSDAEACYRRSLALFRKVGDRGREAAVRNNLADLCSRRGDPSGAQAAHREALALRRQLGDAAGVGASLAALGATVVLGGDAAAALPLLREGLAALEAAGAGELVAETLCAYGQALAQLRRWAEAQEQLEAAARLAVDAADPLREAAACRLLAGVALDQGDLAGARLALARARGRLRELDQPLERARTAVVEARAEAAAGRPRQAAALLARASAAFGALDARLDLAEAMGLAQAFGIEAGPPEPDEVFVGADQAGEGRAG